MAEIRTFIAVEIPDSVRDRIAKVQAELKKHKERISWTKPGNIHLTLKFLGNVDEEKIPAISEIIQEVVKDRKPFSLNVREVGAFPNVSRPRVLWVGIDDNPEIVEIADRIDEGLSQIVFPKEKRKFSPHLTIGRVKSRTGKQFLQNLQNFDFDGGKVDVNEIVVVKSDLKPTGAVYTYLKKIRLQG
ncbi:RNA 2',3'-cyclic phosphodiesterase [candidate division KSB1 bacterium]|nr:RNA 2',3'-cyclic phosphodiesterase [candidate division KSB1 bacterium]NIR69593.1 RNA 2',3'-cyclic phosphodiesterase [candidate division KSB1 bacterium]NIS24310.1 RNA 2',3'-cyclic phosphodiesterase [candidate division KSB1 bacterium]NIT71238.1 RNA 2',3'-cyclic phosphodiesterase [candidate division KSB1 bacterium]NIU24942.1 RNA 2',3'-cyclic phosphodiesterase [candidate division KSB1 bacterium]